MAKATPTDNPELDSVEEEIMEVVATEAADDVTAEIAEAADVETVETDETDAAEDASDEPKLAKAGKRSKKALDEAEAETERKARAAERKDEEDKPKVATKPNPLHMHGKNWRAASEQIDRNKVYELTEAIALVKSTSKVKFDASVELHVNLGVDPRQADQMIRGTMTLPEGTGKKIRVAVIAPADKHEAAKKAGADIVKDDSLLADIEKGKLDFDMLVATPDMMAKLGRVAKVLGPKGLMPNPKSGTVTPDVAKAVSEAKAGRIEYRIDKQAIVHQAIGKISFTEAQLLNNARAMINALLKAKPSAAKGTYVKAISVASTMGPGVKLDVNAAIAEANPKK